MPTAAAKTSVVQEPPRKVEPPQKESPQEARFLDPENFINRELSWLEFNRRVLEEAQDPTQPLIERVKFLTIFSSNLDEFF
jgi:polyphosphate kinase